MSILVIDVGSSSVRALILDDSLEVVASASRAYRLTNTPLGASEIEPASLRSLVEAAISEVLTDPAAAGIRGVGMATFVGNLMGVASDGQPCTPLYTYADSRAAAEVAYLRGKIDPELTHQRTGCLLHTAYHPARIAWIKAQGIAPAAWLDFGTYVYQAWFGRAVPCSYSVAAWSGLLNRETLAWDDLWLGWLGESADKFPILADYTALQRGLAPDYAEKWPVLRDAPFCLAVGDGAAANIGSGAVRVGQMALTIGTTAALRMIDTSPLPTVPRGLWAYRVDKARHLIGGATSEGGSIYQWVRHTFQVPPDAEMQLAQRAPNAHGLTFLPLLAGERSPGWRVHASGAISGLRLSTTPLDVLQAALEGVAARLALIARQIGTAADEIYAGGGALVSSPYWAQLCADAMNTPVYLLGESEVTARGVALLVRQAFGLGNWEDFPPRVAQRLVPREMYREAWAQLMQQQAKLYAADV